MNRATFKFPSPTARMPFDGERYTSGTEGPIQSEHHHRYLFALKFCAGKRVLDIASGEGYGSYLLGQVASEVIGIDIARAAVEFANEAYLSDRVSFVKASATRLPIEDQSIDVVVSFETIEHFAEHDEFLSEIGRVLRAGGMLVISSPNRDVYSDAHNYANPFHVRELNRQEFLDILSSRFPNVQLYEQGVVWGSAIVPIDDSGSRPAEGFTTANGTVFERVRGVPDAPYFVAVASTAQIARPIESILHDPVHYDRLVRRRVEAESEAESVREELVRVKKEETTLRADLANHHKVLVAANETIGVLNEEIRGYETSRIEFEGRLDVSNSRANALQLELADAKTEASRAGDLANVLRTELAVAKSEAARERNKADTLRAESLVVKDEAGCGNDRVNALQEELSVAKAEVSAASNQIHTLQRDLDDATKEVATLSAQAKSLQTEMDQANATNLALAAQLRESAGALRKGREERISVVALIRRILVLRQNVDHSGQGVAIWTAASRVTRHLDDQLERLVHHGLFKRLRRHRRRAEAKRIQQARRLFDPIWYAAQLPETTGNQDLLHHYLTLGVANGLDPSPFFLTAWYLERNPDVVMAGMNPLVHFAAFGGAEGRAPHPLFDSRFYLEANPDVRAAGVNPLLHYVTAGAPELRAPNVEFDPHKYVARFPEAAPNPLMHMILGGKHQSRLRDVNVLIDQALEGLHVYVGEELPNIEDSDIRRMLTDLDEIDSEALNSDPTRELFDREYYLSQHPQLSPGEDPFEHYIRTGAKQGLNPAPLFETRWYEEEYPDVARAGVNPLVHFTQSGGFEGRRPGPLFDSLYYIDRNADVSLSGMNPLLHYIKFGAAELRDPNPFFNSKYYVGEHPEAASNPLAHYAVTGRALGWNTGRIFDIKSYLPRQMAQLVAPEGWAVDIIIPVYRGLEDTRRCIGSVLADPNRRQGRIIVIDDCSPEPALSNWLDAIAAEGKISLHKNARNLGFVGSVNRGMDLAGENDVVLLNSDTEVPSGWLQRLAAHAYSGDKIASVTPFSNNATICSYPSATGGPLPPAHTLVEIDDAAQAANGLRTIEIPTAVGFCMYIRRDCLNDVGPFDEKAFGRGYGEENDFCMRARALGWHHILACDIFVYHAGEVSFGKNSPERDRAWGVLVARHPEYPSIVAKHVESDPAAGARFALSAALFANSSQPTILFVSHKLGGGTERHVQELASAVSGNCNLLLLRGDRAGFDLSVLSVPGHPMLSLPNADALHLVRLLRAMRTDRIHIHHWLGEHYDLRALVDYMGVPFDVSIHDYFSICPQINLLPDPDAPYCGECGLAQCNACISNRRQFGARDIVDWRLAHGWLLQEADRVICPSQDVENRIKRYFPHTNTVVAPHAGRAGDWEVRAETLSAGEPLRIALLGYLAPHKGRKAVNGCVALADPELFDFKLIGQAQPPLASEIAARLKETGVYREEDLASLLADYAPHVVWFPQSWPETYSYTLSAAIDAGLPIVAPKLGAFPERLADRPLTWLQDDPSCLAREWLMTFSAVRSELLDRQGRSQSRPAKIVESYYPVPYLEPTNRSESPAWTIRDIRVAGKITALVVPDRLLDGRISPCGYIRLVLPLDHISAAGPVKIEVVPASGALNRIADILVCQRHFVRELDPADRLIAHCRHVGMKLVYDLDDDLVNFAEEHPERKSLLGLAPIVRHMLAAADEVWVSTEELRWRLKSIRPDAVLMPNRLDERLWVEPSGNGVATDSSVRILYMGTMTHDVDFDMFKVVAERVAEEFGSAVSFEIVGITERSELPSFINRVAVPDRARASYPAFVQWLADERRWDIGVAPLVETPFSRAKSSIKVLDYAALGIPVVASDVTAYSDVGSFGDGVIHVPNNVDSWVAAIRDLASNAARRRTLGLRARSELLERYSLSAANGQWRTALELLVSHERQVDAHARVTA